MASQVPTKKPKALDTAPSTPKKRKQLTASEIAPFSVRVQQVSTELVLLHGTQPQSTAGTSSPADSGDDDGYEAMIGRRTTQIPASAFSSDIFGVLALLTKASAAAVLKHAADSLARIFPFHPPAMNKLLGVKGMVASLATELAALAANAGDVAFAVLCPKPWETVLLSTDFSMELVSSCTEEQLAYVSCMCVRSWGQSRSHLDYVRQCVDHDVTGDAEGMQLFCGDKYSFTAALRQASSEASKIFSRMNRDAMYRHRVAALDTTCLGADICPDTAWLATAAVRAKTADACLFTEGGTHFAEHAAAWGGTGRNVGSAITVLHRDVLPVTAAVVELVGLLHNTRADFKTGFNKTLATVKERLGGKWHEQYCKRVGGDRVKLHAKLRVKPTQQTVAKLLELVTRYVHGARFNHCRNNSVAAQVARSQQSFRGAIAAQSKAQVLASRPSKRKGSQE